MKALIFAAGLGTRLRPYTNDKSKAMVEIGGKTLIEWAIRRLLFFGFNDIVVNVHHFGQLLIDFLNVHKGFGANITISDEREQLLNTGGGLKKAQQWLSDEPFLIYNVDVLSNLPLDVLYQQHLDADPLATLVVRQRESSRYLLFDDELQLSGWRNAKTGEEKIARPQAAYRAMAFSGIHILSPAIFDFMPPESAFSIIDVYLDAAEKTSIKGYHDQHAIWLDVGKIAALEQAEQLVNQIQFH